jgi:chromosomal replication initiation ATPase DnaA
MGVKSPPPRIYASPIGPRRPAVTRDVIDLKPVVLVPNRRKDIAAEVAAAHGMTVQVLRGRSRQKFIVHARRELVWRLHSELGMSLAEIGRFLNQADHTSARHALKKARAQFSQMAAE